MKINWRLYGIDIPSGRTSGNIKVFCPKCHDQRHDKTDRSLSCNLATGEFNCHYCGYKGVATEHTEEDKRKWMEQQAWYNPQPLKRERKEYRKPKPRPQSAMSEKALKWFAGRGISRATVEAMRITEGLEPMPQKEGQKWNTVQFNYYKNGELVNTKFRTGDKCFKMVTGAELLPYNIDGIKGTKECIITEGEMDALSFVEIGFPNVISVPNGASVGKMEYLDSTIDLFNDIEKVYIAVDVDEKGIKLRDELIRRIGAEKCFICNFSEFKDANEYLCHKGRESLLNVLKNAKQVDVEGIVNLPTKLPDIEQLFKEGMQKGATIRQSEVDEYISWELGRLATFTGTPSCFTGERLVHTNLGVKKISELNLDDLVLSYNHDKKVNEYRRVIDKSSNKNKSGKLFRIKMKDGSVIKVTGDHRFFTGTEYLKIEKILLPLEDKLKK